MSKLLLTLIALASAGRAAVFSTTANAFVPPPPAVQKAAKVETGNPGVCGQGTHFFPQPIDHNTFNGDYNDPSQIFLDQYIINDTWYKPGGPILFYQGAEAPVFLCPEYLTPLVDMAEEMGALLVSLEHRYYGISYPYGINATEVTDWKSMAPKMKQLTYNNILKDGHSFLAWIKNHAYPSAKDAKVVTLGGSYGANLALLNRIHFPEIIYATVAYTPVNGLVTDPKDPLTYAFGDWVRARLLSYFKANFE